MKPYLEKPLTGKIGQVIQPGDRVAVVTSGRSGRVNCYEGVYLGCRERPGFRGFDVTTSAIVRVKDVVGGWWKGDKKVRYGQGGTYGRRACERICITRAGLVFAI